MDAAIRKPKPSPSAGHGTHNYSRQTLGIPMFPTVNQCNNLWCMTSVGSDAWKQAHSC